MVNTPPLHEDRLHAMMRLLRPQQWIKNLFVFGPIIFGGALFRGEALLAGLITFFAFSFAASSIYCFNDIHDLPDDIRHPEKCHRPIASGVVTVGQAYGLMVLTFALSMLASLLAGHLRITIGFVLRLFAGGAATGIVLSKWIVLMTFLITLFMSFAKRRDDVLRMEQTGLPPRKNTIRYNSTFINQALTITASVTLVCYIMYTVSPEVIAQFHNDSLYLTSIFVLVGLLRYIQVTVVDKRSGNPTKVILKDHFIQLVVLAWLVAFILIIYAS